MLPSTGYFKGINCPFYDSGLCERPYCHFRHVKKESQNDSIESGAILQKLVSAAVQKVLQQTEGSGVVSPTLVSTEIATNNDGQVSSKASYNPTPISELNKINNELENNEDKPEQQKRHIPIPYTPRKPNIPIKRSTNDNNGHQIFTIIPPAQYSPGSESAQLEKYTPTGGSESSKLYLPGKQTSIPEYIPNDNKTTSKHNYVPSDKTSSKKKILEYKPIKIASKNDIKTVTYQPTPKSLVPCFSSDEDEPDPKKMKLSSDLNGLDDLGAEFDILDQILDEEKFAPEKTGKKEAKIESKKPEYNIIKSKTKDCKENKEERRQVSKKHEKHSQNKLESNEKNHLREIDKKSNRHSKQSHKKEEKDKSHRRSKSSERKSSHKKSVHDKDTKKEKDEKPVKNRGLEKNHDAKKSKSSSRHSSSSKHDTKHRESKHRSSKDKEKRDKHKSDKDKVTENDSHDYEDIIEDELHNISESDEDTMAECKRIFEEYVPTEKVKILDDKKEQNLVENDEYIPSKKRVSRTNEKNMKITPKPSVKPDFKVSAAQAMAERLSKVKEFHAAKKLAETNNDKSNQTLKPDIVKSYFSASSNGNAKVRIAHVPYASTLITAKKEIAPSTKITKNIEPSTSSTITQTVKKGTQRVAHVPSEKFVDRPGVLEPLASKIPANIRSTYLNMMIDHCLKIYLSATDAYARAQHEELTTSKKCSTVQIYKNSAVLAISRLKKEVQEGNGIKKSGSDCTALNKSATPTNGKPGGSWSIESKNKRNFDDLHQFTGIKLYNNISKWILTEEQLVENGFPRPHVSGEKGRAIIVGQNKQKPPKGLIRTCCRCKKDYTVDKKGLAIVKEECIYHPNNKYRIRGEVRYQCCSQDGSSDGCCVASSHVYEYVDFDNLRGFVKTLPPDPRMDDYGVYSLDCEMCYTTHGLDLTRITVIDSACKVIYETLIKPLHPIVDYNTRYSGITEEQMAEVNTTLLDVQATLLSMFNSKTILIGHSLESDFKALKLIHDTVVDTSVLFPHKMGPPYKRALRNLSSEYLRKIIQNSVDGHDSAEDATVCMELILYKLKEDLKTR